MALLLLIAPLSRAAAQDEIYTWTDDNGVVHFSNSAPPQGAKATPVVTGTEFKSVPLEVDARHPSRKFARVEIQGTNDKAEVRMVVDTGAETTMIDPGLARTIGVRWLRGQVVGGVTGVGLGAVVEVPMLRVGSAELRNVSIVVGPARGINLLGMDVLNKLELSVGQNSLYRSSR